MNETDSNELQEDNQILQILSFELDQAWFGIEIERIQEVLEYRSITKVPQTPDFMLGVINLRGRVIPVVDLRRQFAMQAKERDIDTCIIIVHVLVEDELTALGILADRVQEVVEIETNSIKPAPRIGSKVNTLYIQGMAKHGEDFIILLDVIKIFSSDDLGSVMQESTQMDNTPSVEYESHA